MPKKVDDVQAFITEAQERYKAGLDADVEDRREAEADVRFAAALPVPDAGTSQWDDTAARARIAARRPCLTWNRLPTFLAQVINDSRQNKPAIKVAPIKDGTVPTSKFLQDRIRQIEYDCNADIAYDTAAEQQTTCGRAWTRITTERIPGTSRLRLCIDPIQNQFSVVWDPGAVKYDTSDADWKFVVSYITREKHKRLYPNASLSSTDFVGAEYDNPAPEWVGVGTNGDMIQVAEYWVREWSDLGKKVPKCEIWQYIINGIEILKQTKWIDDQCIPIIPTWGRQSFVDGYKRTFSLIRPAKDPQQMLNVAVSNLAELVGQLPKVPYMVPNGAIPANSEQDWAAAHYQPLAYLLYNQYDAEGRQLNEPQRITQDPPIEALVVLINQSVEAIKAGMGIYDASLGAKSNETSGIAIQRRQKESDVTNFHFPDNQARTRKTIGEILVRCIPKVDGSEDEVPVRSEDGKTAMVPLGVLHKDPKTGQPVIHDLSQGQYGVAISSGPSVTSQRQEAYDRDAAIIQAAPELVWVFGDQLFANDDTAGAEERSERMKRAIMLKSPGLIQQPNQQQPNAEALQQQNGQLQQQLQQVHQFAASLHEQLQTKQPEIQGKLAQAQMDDATKRYIVDQQELTKRTATEAQINAQLAIAQLEREIQGVEGRSDRQHEVNMKLADQQQAKETQQTQQAHESSENAIQQATDQQTQAEQSDGEE